MSYHPAGSGVVGVKFNRFFKVADSFVIFPPGIVEVSEHHISGVIFGVELQSPQSGILSFSSFLHVVAYQSEISVCPMNSGVFLHQARALLPYRDQTFFINSCSGNDQLKPCLVIPGVVFESLASRVDGRPVHIPEVVSMSHLQEEVGVTGGAFLLPFQLRQFLVQKPGEGNFPGHTHISMLLFLKFINTLL